MHRVVLVGMLLLACTDRPIDEADDEVAEGGSESEATSEETAEPGCDPDQCTYHCMHDKDQCGEPQAGSCSDADVCVCEQVSDCRPCESENCSVYELCYEPYSLGGECGISCFHEFHFTWIPEVGCVLGLPSDVPITSAFVDGRFYVEIEGRLIPRAEGCNVPEGWILDADDLNVVLCADACALFEAAGELFTGWGKYVVCE